MAPPKVATSINIRKREADALLVDNNSYYERGGNSAHSTRSDVPPKFKRHKKFQPVAIGGTACTTAAVGGVVENHDEVSSQDDNREDIAIVRNYDHRASDGHTIRCRSLSSSTTTSRKVLEGTGPGEFTLAPMACPKWTSRAEEPETYKEKDILVTKKKPYPRPRKEGPKRDIYLEREDKNKQYFGRSSINSDAHLRRPLSKANSSSIAAMALTSLMNKTQTTYFAASWNAGREEVEYNTTTDQDCRDSVHLSSSDELSSPCCEEEDEDNMKRPSFNRVSSSSVSSTSPSLSNKTATNVAVLNANSKNVQSYDDTWKIRYNDLVAYKEQHGDCLVPKKSNTHPQLGIWVMNQRGKVFSALFSV